MLIFGTTHLWYMSSNPKSKYYQPGSDEARVYQLGIMMDKAEEFADKYNCPIVLVGDMNAWGTSQCVQSAYVRGYSDARDIAVEYADGGHGMHKCGDDGYAPYVPDDPIKAIDRVFIKNAPEGFVRRFERYNEEYYMPLSDHLPVYIDVEF